MMRRLCARLCDTLRWGRNEWQATDELPAGARWLVAALLASVIVVLFTRVGASLPDTLLSYDNADVLYPEQYARDLLAGVSPWDWFNTQAPYFFPDILMLSGLVSLGTAFTTTSVVYTLVSALSFFAVWSVAAGFVGLRGWRWVLASCAAALISCACLWGEWANVHSWFYTLAYVHLSGHHGGYGLMLPFTAWLAARLARRPQAGWGMLLGLLAALLFLSDMLFAFAFAAPTTIWLACLWRRGVLPRGHFLAVFGILLSAFVASRLFGMLTPYPGDQAFLEYLLQHWPESVPLTLRSFGHDLVHYYFSLRGSSGWLGFGFLASNFCLIRWLRRQEKHRLPEQAALTLQLLAFAALLGFWLVLIPQLGLGVYSSNANSRHIAALMPLAWMTAVILWLRDRPMPRRIGPAALSLGAVAATVLLLALGFGQGIQKNPAPMLTSGVDMRCYAALMEERGMKSVLTDYWIARPLWMGSGGRVTGVPSNPDMVPYLNASNVARSWASEPDGVLVWDEASRTEALRLFGPPRSVESCPWWSPTQTQRSPWRLYDYRNQLRVKAWTKRLDILYFTPGADRVELPASSLFHTLGADRVQGTSVRLLGKDSLFDGSAIRLPQGTYIFRFHLAAPGDAVALHLQLDGVSLTGKTEPMQEWDLTADTAGILQTQLHVPAQADRLSKVLRYRFATPEPALLEKLEIIRLR